MVSTNDLTLSAPSQREGRTWDLLLPAACFGGNPPRGGCADLGNLFPAAQTPEHVNQPFCALPCLTPYTQALCFLWGNSGILQWWKDSLIILHTKKMVIVFHFTWKLMDLGTPDVDAQNSLRSLSGDLSSPGCLWRTPVSAEVICEPLHTKSRFLREEVRAHTHIQPPPTHPPPLCPAPCLQVLLQRAETWGGTSHLRGNLNGKGRAGFAPKRGTAPAELCMLQSSGNLRSCGKGLRVLLSPMLCWGWCQQRLGWMLPPYSLWTQWFSHGTGSPTCMSPTLPFCQALGLHIELSTWARRGAYGNRVSAGIKQLKKKKEILHLMF